MRLRKRQRLMLVMALLVLLGGATGLALLAFSDSIAFFVTPTDIATKRIDPGQRFRLGGVVVPGSIERTAADGTVSFALTDKVHQVRVRYRGLLPDLFREGQGIVAQGHIDGDGVFIASEVLAKHDERYMPPEVANALKAAGRWREGAIDQAAAAGAKP
jgi:cytochrome c-type biogenesis protein CcmE